MRKRMVVILLFSFLILWLLDIPILGEERKVILPKSAVKQSVTGVRVGQTLADFDIAALPHSFEEALALKQP